MRVEYVYSEVCEPYFGYAVYEGGRELEARHVAGGDAAFPDDPSGFPAIAGYRLELDAGEDGECPTLYTLDVDGSVAG